MKAESSNPIDKHVWARVPLLRHCALEIGVLSVWSILTRLLLPEGTGCTR
jgi:hypothetical protein